MIPTLTTARLVLRPLRQDDAAALHALYGDVEANRWASRAAHRTIEETHERIARTLAAPDWRAWAVTLAGDDRAIGTVGAHATRQERVVEIAYQLDRPHWGRGLATEAAGALIDSLFVEGNRRVWADTDPDNTPSNRVLERLGFTLEGRLRGEWLTHIGVRDSLIWGLLADEWKNRGQ